MHHVLGVVIWRPTILTLLLSTTRLMWLQRLAVSGLLGGMVWDGLDSRTWRDAGRDTRWRLILPACGWHIVVHNLVDFDENGATRTDGSFCVMLSSGVIWTGIVRACI
jgi:hypothetical protein